MNDTRQGPPTAPAHAQQILADLEAADQKLARAAARNGGMKEIEAARALVRAAISALARPPSSEGSTSKQRVKIKAESEVATAEQSASTAARSKSGAAVGKPANRGARSPEGARGTRPPSPALENSPGGSLIARLGAATGESTTADQAVPTIAEVSPNPGKSSTFLSPTAERLAQLEAEIADLTDALTAPPTRTAPPETEAEPETKRENPVPPPAEAHGASPTSAAAAPDAGRNADDDDTNDEEAEITIIGPDGTPAEPAADSARRTPRIFRESPGPYEEEAEVEIRGSTTSTAGDPAAAGRARASPEAATAKSGARGKWRLFRGS